MQLFDKLTVRLLKVGIGLVVCLLLCYQIMNATPYLAHAGPGLPELPATLYILTSDNEIVLLGRNGQLLGPVTNERVTIDDFDVSPTHGRVIYTTDSQLIEFDPRTNKRVIRFDSMLASLGPISLPRYADNGNQIRFMMQDQLWVTRSEMSADSNISPLSQPDNIVPTTGTTLFDTHCRLDSSHKMDSCNYLSFYQLADGGGFALRGDNEQIGGYNAEILYIDQNGQHELLMPLKLAADGPILWASDGRGLVALAHAQDKDLATPETLYWYGFSEKNTTTLEIDLAVAGTIVRWGPTDSAVGSPLVPTPPAPTPRTHVTSAVESFVQPTPESKPTPIPDVIDEIGDYTLRIWSGTLNIASHLPNRGYYGTATLTHKDGHMTVVPHGVKRQPLPVEDVTGDGYPDVAILTKDGGSHCCSGTLLYSLNSTPTIELTYWGGHGDWQDLDDNGRHEFIARESPPGYPCSVAEIMVILRHETDRGYVGATPHFARFYEAEIERLRQQAETNSDKQCDIAPLVAAYYYIGQAEKGWAEFDRIYSGTQDTADFRSRLTESVKRSEFYVAPAPEPKMIKSTAILPTPLYYLNEENQISRLIGTSPDYVEEQITNRPIAINDFDVSPTQDRLVYLSDNQLIELDLTTRTEMQLVAAPKLKEFSESGGDDETAYLILAPRYSPDGTKIAYVQGGVNLISSGLAPNSEPVRLLPHVQVGSAASGITESHLPKAKNIDDLRFYQEIRWSPDGKHLLLRAYVWEGSLYEIYDLEAKTRTPPLMSQVSVLALNWGWAWGHDGQIGYVASNGRNLGHPVDVDMGLSRVDIESGEVTLLDTGHYAATSNSKERPFPRAATALHSLPNGEQLLFIDTAIRPDFWDLRHHLALFRRTTDGELVQEIPHTFTQEGEILWARDGRGALLVQDVWKDNGRYQHADDYLYPLGTLYWMSREEKILINLHIEGRRLRWGHSDQ